MMVFLISIIGLLIVNRFFFRLYKANLISDKKTRCLFWVFIVPILFSLFFKDPMIALCLYIGIFLLGLILFFILFDQIMKNVFENSKIQLLDALILQIRVGHSPQKALAESLYSCTHLEKNIFDPIKYVFSNDFSSEQIQFKFTKHYILELRTILVSSARVVEQIQSLRDGLKIQFQFQFKSKQITQQIKAQAIVAFVIYLMIFVISYQNLGLKEYPVLMALSTLMFVVGLILVFKLGGNIKWKI
jgi:predicted RNA binding protein with dsRBD fold (UPF0201 family)